MLDVRHEIFVQVPKETTAFELHCNKGRTGVCEDAGSVWKAVGLEYKHCRRNKSNLDYRSSLTHVMLLTRAI